MGGMNASPRDKPRFGAIWWLSQTDSKRRRVFTMALFSGKRHAGFALAALLLPGLALATFGTAAQALVWLGAVLALGWLLAALTPEAQTSSQRGIQRRADDALRALGFAIDDPADTPLPRRPSPVLLVSLVRQANGGFCVLQDESFASQFLQATLRDLVWEGGHRGQIAGIAIAFIAERHAPKPCIGVF